MKPALFVCIKNPFTQRDLERMGIEELERHFDLQILDCTAWLMPDAHSTRGLAGLARANLRTVRSLREFKAALGGARGGYAIDYVGQFSPQAILMFDALKSRGFQLIVLDSGACPVPDSTLGTRSLAQKILGVFRHGGLRLHLNARINRFLLACLPDQRADFALVSGSSWKQDPRFAQASHKIEAHSFDYERYRQISAADRAPDPSLPARYAVYLDEDIVDHEDNKEMNLASPASAGFYPAMVRLFDRFEAATGIRVVIAGYPSKRPSAAGRFGPRPVFLGRTAELIRDASLVFAHASTAISFAVLWRRPLVFLTSHEIGKSWYQPWIEAPRALLRAPMLDIDLETADVSALHAGMDAAAYEIYQTKFIKSSRSPDASLWEIFLGVMESRFDGR